MNDAPHILIIVPELKELEPDDNLATISTARELAKHYDRLGYSNAIRHFEYLPQTFKTVVDEEQPDCVFNLVESVSGTSRLIHVPPIYLEELRIPYTGCPAHAIELSNDKVLAKHILQLLKVPTPRWGTPKTLPAGEGGTWIVKAQHEHASFGLTQANVVQGTTAAIARAHELAKEHKIEWMIEEFVDGREFNVSMVETPDGPRVLPSAEIVFQNYGTDLHKIIDYRAKWDDQSFEYQNTIRRADFSPADRSLLKELQDISLKVWEGFDLRGWARVDFRIDAANNPFVIDVNANPDLSLDAGFMAAAGRAQISPHEAIRMITDAAMLAG
ncbi:MAG: ATP-grasp domain-containing protein [Alphaproteobacteria bacterium]|nr:ATP-grasp domain-containing protein [Alphaproteobacteria bacterium]